jgi:hypothetical protein
MIRHERFSVVIHFQDKNYLSLTESERRSIDLELDVRNQYTQPDFLELHKSEHDRAKKILDSYSVNKITWSDFSAKTKTVLRSRKVLQVSKYFANHSPELIIEFGAGASTYFVAHCLKRQYEETGLKGRIVSLEQSQVYHSLLNQYIPDELKDFCEIRLSDVQLEYVGEYLTVSYVNHPVVDDVDLVYVDGPATPRVLCNGKPRKIFSGDLLRLVNSGVSVRNACTDVRWFNLGFFTDYLGDKYHISPDIEFKSIVLTEK